MAARVARAKGPLQERFGGLVAIIIVCFVFQISLPGLYHEGIAPPIGIAKEFSTSAAASSGGGGEIRPLTPPRKETASRPSSSTGNGAVPRMVVVGAVRRLGRPFPVEDTIRELSVPSPPMIRYSQLKDFKYAIRRWENLPQPAQKPPHTAWESLNITALCSSQKESARTAPCACPVAFQGKRCETAVAGLGWANRSSAASPERIVFAQDGLESSIVALQDSEVPNSTVKIPISKELWVAQPSSDPFQSFELGSCALIGSSGSSWLYKNGEWIDSHDTVIRLNADPIEPSAAMQRRGFTSFPVGNKTSLRVQEIASAGFRESTNETLLLVPTSQNSFYHHIIIRRKVPHLPIYLLSYTIYQRAIGLLKLATELINSSELPFMSPHVHFSALALALSRCTSVTLFGFAITKSLMPKYFTDAPVPTSSASVDATQELLFAALIDYLDEDVDLVASAEPCAFNKCRPCKLCSPGSACACNPWSPDEDSVIEEEIDNLLLEAKTSLNASSADPLDGVKFYTIISTESESNTGTRANSSSNLDSSLETVPVLFSRNPRGNETQVVNDLDFKANSTSNSSVPYFAPDDTAINSTTLRRRRSVLEKGTEEGAMHKRGSDINLAMGAGESNGLQDVMAGEKSIEAALRGSLYQLCEDDSACISHWNERLHAKAQQAFRQSLWSAALGDDADEDDFPAPAALPGFCRVPSISNASSSLCYLRCPQGLTQCPGGVFYSKCPLKLWHGTGKNVSCASQEDIGQVRATVSPEEWDHALYRAGFKHLIRPRRLPQDQDDSNATSVKT